VRFSPDAFPPGSDKDPCVHRSRVRRVLERGQASFVPFRKGTLPFRKQVSGSAVLQPANAAESARKIRRMLRRFASRSGPDRRNPESNPLQPQQETGFVAKIVPIIDRARSKRKLFISNYQCISTDRTAPARKNSRLMNLARYITLSFHYLYQTPHSAARVPNFGYPNSILAIQLASWLALIQEGKRRSW
jgi:hypothetical protein